MFQLLIPTQPQSWGHGQGRTSDFRKPRWLPFPASTSDHGRRAGEARQEPGWSERALRVAVVYDYGGFSPCGSSPKESACNAGGLGSIPGLEDPLKKGTATQYSILAWRIPWTVLVHAVAKSRTPLALVLQHHKHSRSK